MSLELFDDVICIDLDTGARLDHHSILVGKKCAYCMNCGQILMEYENKDFIKRLMDPFGDDDE